jgi:hypothetical protein
VETFALGDVFHGGGNHLFFGLHLFLLAEWRWHFPCALTSATFLSDSRGRELQNFHEKRDAC